MTYNITDTEEFQITIHGDKTILIVEPHPDDAAIMMPGVLATNTTYVCCLGSMQNVPQHMRTNRLIAIDWIRDNHVASYDFLENIYPMTPIKEQIKTQLKNYIENLHPDEIYTFTPYGWYGHPEHILCNQIVMEVIPQLSYTPIVYWFVNTDQSIPFQDFNEDDMYSPTDTIDINWNDKLAIWTAFAPSVGALNQLINNTNRLAMNDRKEYFKKVI